MPTFTVARFGLTLESYLNHFNFKGAKSHRQKLIEQRWNEAWKIACSNPGRVIVYDPQNVISTHVGGTDKTLPVAYPANQPYSPEAIFAYCHDSGEYPTGLLQTIHTYLRDNGVDTCAFIVKADQLPHMYVGQHPFLLVFVQSA